MAQALRAQGWQLRYLRRAVRQGGWVAWAFVGTLLAMALVSVVVLTVTVRERFRRDVMRMAFNGNLELLDDVKRRVDASRDTLDQQVASVATPPPGDHPYIVVSIREKRLWYRQGDRTIFTTRVATGTGKELIQNGPNGGVHWKFETPRGRLVVESKETDPVWVPPDWHYVEMARKKRLGVVKLARGKPIPIGGGAVITVDGTDVVTRYPDGREVPFEVHEGKEIVANKNIVIPPYGTEQRKYLGTLGVNRLYLGDGYGIHGTDEPASIGSAASHGCVRLRNEDIEALFRIVPIGTVVYIY
jgi:lipoprotein-anchoring transpeptidase ErfK/SrfK